MLEQHETVIIGGGQAGLATGYYLKQLGREFLILEQSSQAANAWRNDRWDSFTYVTPNWTFRMPGAEYRGPFPDGFLTRDEIVSSFEKYIELNHLPVRYGEKVTTVEKSAEGSEYRVTTENNVYTARNVVVATGLFQKPRLPACSQLIDPEVTQITAGKYRNPKSIPPGAVLVVGSAQSGSQIAEELYQSGRKVFLSTSSAGRVPRRYRGKDVVTWMNLSGFFDRTVENLPSPKARFGPNPHLTGRNGGHTLNLHQFSRDGVVLLGHLKDAHEWKFWFEPDLKENLTKSDQFEATLCQQLDEYISSNWIEAPREDLPALRDGYRAKEITELDLPRSGITTIIWAMGYSFNYDMVKLPVTDSDGFPVQKRGVTDYPGLYFIGMPWLHKRKSGLLLGVGDDADHIATKISERAG